MRKSYRITLAVIVLPVVVLVTVIALSSMVRFLDGVWPGISRDPACLARVTTTGYFRAVLEPFLRRDSFGWPERTSGGPHTMIHLETYLDPNSENNIVVNVLASYRTVPDLNARAVIGIDWNRCIPVIVHTVTDNNER